MAKKKLTEDECRKLVEKFLKAKDRGKKGYSQADAALEELLAGGLQVGKKIPLAAGRVAELADLFATKNKVFKPCGVGRFELVVSHDAG